MNAGRQPPLLALTLLFLCTLTANSLKATPQAFLGPTAAVTEIFLSENVVHDNKATQNWGKFTIVKSIPREGKLFFTEGLSFKDADTLLESSGTYGDSVIQYLSSNDMKVLQQQTLDNSLFGEGCEIVSHDNDNQIYQMTWRERKLLVWDANTLVLKKTIDIPEQIREGWGMTKRIEKDEHRNNVTRLYITDGSSNIHIVDPVDFKVLKSLDVRTSDNQALDNLNELEFVKGKLWANIFLSDNIAIINPETGVLEAMIDMSSLTDQVRNDATGAGKMWSSNNVLNGIAYHPETDRLLVTGKMWPTMWEIKVEGV